MADCKYCNRKLISINSSPLFCPCCDVIEDSEKMFVENMTIEEQNSFDNRRRHDCKEKYESTNKKARSRANQHIQNLETFTVKQLKTLCKILGAQQSRCVKGGRWQFYTKDELAARIRSVIGRGTFADRLTHFSDTADEFVNRG